MNLKRVDYNPGHPASDSLNCVAYFDLTSYELCSAGFEGRDAAFRYTEMLSKINLGELKQFACDLEKFLVAFGREMPPSKEKDKARELYMFAKKLGAI